MTAPSEHEGKSVTGNGGTAAVADPRVEPAPDDERTRAGRGSRELYHCFLSLPHEVHDLREAIKRTLASLMEYEVRCRYVTESRGDELRDEVIAELSQSDFIIADVSSGTADCRGPRPNVMWELGYAWRLGLVPIIVVNEAEPQNVSSLIRSRHYTEYNPHQTDAFLSRLANVVEVVCSTIETKRTQERAAGRYSATVYVDRLEINMPKCIRDAKNNVRILETNLQYVEEELGRHLIKALQDPERPHLTVQVCTLNPHSEFARARAVQLARLEKDYEGELLRALNNTYDMLSACDQDRWQLKVYDTFPTQITFAFERAVFSSVMSLGKKSREMVHFQVNTWDRNASDTFQAHFNQIYSQSDTYEEWLKKERVSHKK